MTLQWVGGLIALVTITVAVICLVAVHVLPTGLHPLRDPVSQYHLTPYRAWATAAAIFEGLAGIGALLALAGLVGAAGALSCVLVGIFAASWLLIPFLRMDAPGSPRTPVGRLHNILAFVGFGAMTAAAYVAGGALHDAGYTGAATWSTVFAVVMTVGAVGLAILLARRHARLFGLFERLIYVGFIGWFALIGIAGLSG